MSTDLFDHGFSFLLGLAFALSARALGVNELARGYNDNFKVSSGLRVFLSDNSHLPRKGVFKRYCERIEVALKWSEINMLFGKINVS